jgi:hypothetical protein
VVVPHEAVVGPALRLLQARPPAVHRRQPPLQMQMRRAGAHVAVVAFAAALLPNPGFPSCRGLRLSTTITRRMNPSTIRKDIA